MKPFAIERVWNAGRPAVVAERGSTLALLATVRRITAAAASPGGCPCCRCSGPIRCTADLRCVTIAVAQSDIEEYRVLVRAYCSRCASDTAKAMAACEHGAIPLRFRVRVPPSGADLNLPDHGVNPRSVAAAVCPGLVRRRPFDDLV